MASLIVAASQRCVATGGPEPQREGALGLEVVAQGAQQLDESRRAPVDARPLGHVGERPLDPGERPVQHESRADHPPTLEPAHRLVPPVALHLTPRRGLQEARRRLRAQPGEVLLRGDVTDGDGGVHGRSRYPSATAAPHTSPRPAAYPGRAPPRRQRPPQPVCRLAQPQPIVRGSGGRRGLSR